jgi:hypothetical protein
VILFVEALGRSLYLLLFERAFLQSAGQARLAAEVAVVVLTGLLAMLFGAYVVEKHAECVLKNHIAAAREGEEAEEAASERPR